MNYLHECPFWVAVPMGGIKENERKLRDYSLSRTHACDTSLSVVV